MVDNTQNFYQIQQQFNHDNRSLIREMSHEATRNQLAQQSPKGGSAQMAEESEAGKEGYLQYKRWEYFMEPRVFPSGDLSLPSTNWSKFEDYLNNNPAAMQQYQMGQGNHSTQHNSGPVSIQSSTWIFQGPTGAPTNGGAGRIGFVRVDPTNPLIIWVGAPAGGLWKSINGGSSWTTNTDFLTVIGASDVAIDPSNTLNMYLATGDGDAGDTYSTGVLKSTDGGVTWNTTGLSWTPNQGRTISKLLINPTTPSTIMAFSNTGIWRTTNSGTTWTPVQSANSFKDAEFMPGAPNTVYACGTTFWKSTDGGATWANITSGVPAAASVDRLAIAVTAAATGTIYMLAGSAATDGFFGLYKSTNSGTSFTTVTVTSPSNVLGWASAGNDSGGQGWYDLVIDASPTNANEICVGGVNIWRSTNGGTSFTLNGHWTGSGAPYVHADHHAMIYVNGTTMYEGCDGGVFKTTNNGTTWLDVSANLCIAQSYRIGVSGSNPTLWITGHQDNGTNLKNGASYVETMGGDGMDCFIDRTNNNVMYGSQYSGSLNRSTNGGASWSGITTGLSGTAPWVTSWYQDPTTANTIYCGRTNLFKSTNQGTAWAAVASAVPGAGTIVDFKIAPSNNQVIYVVKSNACYKTVNGGGAWTTITGTLPVGSAVITRVDVKPTDPLVAYVTFSGYSPGNKVFKTINGGTSWTNVSTGLPNLPINCVRFDASSAIEGVYVGCDVGVYYCDNTFAGVWQPYFTSLPNVPIFDLEVYTPTGKLYASSYGRGIWQTDIYNPGTLPPIANFSASTYITCVGSPVNFTDLSSFTPTSWTWTFPSGSPATSTAQNPTGISWSTAGTYTVSLVVSNANGTSSPATQVITVLPSQAPPLVEGFQTATFVPTGWTANNINNDGVFWNLSTTVGSASTQSARFDNYTLDVAGAKDEMWAPRLNCTGFTTLQMTFDVAYARYDATYSDSLQVLVSTDCGATWTSVYLKGGGPVAAGNLATAPDQTATIFVPTAGQWRNETVTLNAYAGQSSVLIIFRNRGHYGQALYLDNINITGTVSLIPSATFTASTLSTCVGSPINFTDASSGTPTSWTWTFPSGTPASATTANVTGVTWATAGTYTVTHTATNANGTGTSTQVVTINALPTITTTTTAATICVGGSSSMTASGGVTYTWMPGSLTGTTVSVTPVATTTYTVTGTNASGCTNTSTRTITVTPTPTVTVTAAPSTICSGGSTTLTAAGATTYSWMPGSLTGTSVTVSPAATTTYTVTGTTGTCNANATQLITVNVSPTVTTTTTGATICSGNSTTITAAGASTYAWMPGSLTGTTVTVTPATTTTYTVTGTSASGCTGTATRIITVTPTPTVTATASSPSICSGNPVTLTATGATTYLWMPGSLAGASVTTTPASTTTYTVTGTSGTCTSTATVTVTVGAPPTVTVSATSTTICNGSSTTLTAAGAGTYTWMPGSLSGTSVTVTPAATTTYTVTGTTGPGCSNTATIAITVNPVPTVTTTTTGGTICSGSTTTITAAGASTYAWMPGSLTGTTVSVTPATTTTYTVTGTSASGCTNTATRTITVNPTPTVTATTSASPICSGNTVTLTATGATTYNWMPGNVNGAVITRTPATTTTYTVTGTLGTCTSTATVTVTVAPPPTVTASASPTSVCAGSSTTLTGVGATTYTWMPGSLSGTTVTVTPAATTTYTVTGSNGPGCTGTSTLLVTVNPLPTVSTTTTAATICSGNNTSITASGAATYTWMPGSLSGTTVTVSPVATTTYTVTGTAASGCANTATRTITVNPTPTVTATISNASVCSGTTVTLTASGASTYNWQPINLNGASVTATPIANTTYTVTGTDVSGCTGTATVAVTMSPSPVVNATISNSNVCSGTTVTLTASGATTYNWMPGNIAGSPVNDTPIISTTYTVTGTDPSGCFGTATVSVTIAPSPTVTATISNASVCSGTSVTLTATGATTYNWQPINLNGASVNDSPVTNVTYTVTGTDPSGCTGTATVSVNVNTSPVVVATPSANAVCFGSSVNLVGTGASTYNWQPINISGANITDTPPATITYTLTGTDVNGCTGTDTASVAVYLQPTISISGVTVICPGNSVVLIASGGATYVWQPGGQTTASITDSPILNTTYTVTGTDAAGCFNSTTHTVSIDTPPTLPGISVNGSVLTSTVTGNSYQWFLNGVPIPFATSQSYTATQMGSFTVEVYDLAGCGSGQSTAVIDPTGIAVATNVDAFNVIPNPNDGHFQLSFNLTKSDNYVIEIHDMLGQVVYSEALNNFKGNYNQQIDLSIYGRGVYTIRLRSSSNETTIKAITY